MPGDNSNSCGSSPSTLLPALLRAGINGSAPPAIDDWKSVFSAAIRHGVSAFAFPFVRSAYASSIPGDILAAWRRNAFAFAQRATLIDAQRTALFDTLRDASVKCIPVKGAWLSARVYPADSIRAMTDLDILVKPRDVQRAIDAMTSKGYVLKRGADATNSQVTDTALTHPALPCPVDIHWSYDSAPGSRMPPAPMDTLWSGARPDAIDGHEFLALAPEDHLVLLANHLFHHDFARPLRAHLDMALLLRKLAKDGCDASRLRSTAEAWGMTRAVALATAVASDLFGAPGELVALGIVPPPDWEPEKRRAAFSLALETRDASEPSAVRRIAEFQKLGFSSRLRFIASRIMISNDAIRARYPWATTPWKLARARCVRIKDLVVGHGRDAAKAIASRDALPAAAEERLRLTDWAMDN